MYKTTLLAPSIAIIEIRLENSGAYTDYLFTDKSLEIVVKLAYVLGAHAKSNLVTLFNATIVAKLLDVKKMLGHLLELVLDNWLTIVLEINGDNVLMHKMYLKSFIKDYFLENQIIWLGTHNLWWWSNY